MNKQIPYRFIISIDYAPRNYPRNLNSVKLIYLSYNTYFVHFLRVTHERRKNKQTKMTGRWHNFGHATTLYFYTKLPKLMFLHEITFAICSVCQKTKEARCITERQRQW